MSLLQKQPRLSVAEYLQGERESPIRHEYVDGQLYALAGASANHNRLALNLASRLSDHLGSGPCQTFISDMKVRVNEDVFYYPDVLVSCDPLDREPYLRIRPRLIIEVASPSTQRSDYYEKRLAYQGIPSLQEYLVLSQDRMLVDIFRRQGGGHWSRETLTQSDEALRLESVQLSLPLVDVYRNVEW